MTRDDIFRMAQEAGAFVLGDFIEAGEMDIEQFAELVAAAERERIAKQFDSGVVNVRARGQE